MEILDSYKKYNHQEKSVVIIGKFDGLHLGHRELFSRGNWYKQKGYRLVAMTFDLGGGQYIFSEKDREKIFEELMVDTLIIEKPRKEFFDLTPEKFVKEVLVLTLNVDIILCGEDFCFGKNREGNAKRLLELGKTHNLLCEVFKKIVYKDLPISSTRIRDALKEGDIISANEMLSKPYSISGIVVHGKMLGRTFNYPTANVLYPDSSVVLKFGVYATKVYYKGKCYIGVTNVGIKPSVTDEKVLLIETHLLDFEGDLYDKEIRIEFYKFFREEKKFENVEALFARINQDAKDIRKYMEIIK